MSQHKSIEDLLYRAVYARFLGSQIPGSAWVWNSGYLAKTKRLAKKTILENVNFAIWLKA